MTRNQIATFIRYDLGMHVDDLLNFLFATYLFIGSIFSKKYKTALWIKKESKKLSGQVEKHVQKVYAERTKTMGQVKAHSHVSNLKDLFYLTQAKSYLETRRKIDDIRYEAAVDLVTLPNYKETLKQFGEKQADTVEWWDKHTININERKGGLFSINEEYYMKTSLLLNEYITFHRYDSLVNIFLRKNISKDLDGIQGFIFFVQDYLLLGNAK